MIRGGLGLGLVAGVLAAPFAAELRIARPRQPLTEAWQEVPVEPRGPTRLGISFRPRQVEALGMDEGSTFETLLAYPFQLVRLGAYWDRVEPRPGVFDPSELDRLLEAVERAGKQAIVAVGALKTFGYPELFVPRHHLTRPLPERTVIRPEAYPSLLTAATDFVGRIVDRYKNRACVVGWQVENEAVDPLGFEHSWRLDTRWVEREMAAVRRADPSRPVLLNGYFPASLPVALAQWVQTRDQGDSIALAHRIADVVGVDYYPCHALAGFAGRALYLDSTGGPWHGWARRRLFARARASGRRLMVSEGQAEPWEAVTTPPNPRGWTMRSCPPERMVESYNRWMAWAREARRPLDAYLFWGAEYWVLRRRSGDSSYLRAFEKILSA